MSTKMLALVAVAGLALAGYASAASQGLLPESMDMGLGANKRCERADASAQGLAEKCAALRPRHAQRAERRGDGPGPGLPPFRMDNGTVEGRWVSFTVADGELLDYTSKGPFADAVVFDRIAVSPDSDEDRTGVRGPLWLGKEGMVGAAAFNLPNAFLAARNFGDEVATVTFEVAEGIGAEEGERGIVLTSGDHRAHLRALGNGTLALEDGVVTATLAKGDGVAFAIEGYPRMLHWETQALRQLGHYLAGRGDAGEPAPEPVPADVAAEASAEA